MQDSDPEGAREPWSVTMTPVLVKFMVRCGNNLPDQAPDITFTSTMTFTFICFDTANQNNAGKRPFT